MTNYEVYAEEIKRITLAGDSLAIDKRTGRCLGCDECDDCSNCIFSYSHEHRYDCTKTRRDWMNSEYKVTTNSSLCQGLDVNTLLWVWDDDIKDKKIRFFSRYDVNDDAVYCFEDGKSSFETSLDCPWKRAELFKIDEVKR